MKIYDFIVIGSGSGGGTAAILAAQQKASVALIDKGPIGGVTLHWGCIPIKSMVASAKMLAHAQHSESYGVSIDHVSFSLAAWVNRQRLVTAKLAQEMDRTLRRNGVEIFQGQASFSSPSVVRIRHNDDEEEIEGRKIIIATGSHAVPFPNIANDARLLVGTSNDFVHMTHLPQRLLIIGGGYIGCELCGIYSALGCKITIIEAGPHLLPDLEPEAGAFLHKKFEQAGVTVRLDSRVAEITRDKENSRANARLELGEIIQEDKVLVTIGRVPNFNDLELDKVGIDHDRAIHVNEFLQTNHPHIYAIGDVNGLCALSHSAAAQASVAVEHACGESRRIHFDQIPYCVLTNPEISAVGLSESDAVQRGLRIKVGRCSFRNVGRALALGELDGFVKLVAEERTGKILGGLIIGSNASELIAPIVLALQLGATAQHLAQTTFARPSLSEAIQEAARRILDHPLLGV